MLIRLTLQRAYDGYAYHYFCKYEHATSTHTRNENCAVVTLALLVEPLHITVTMKRLRDVRSTGLMVERKGAVGRM